MYTIKVVSINYIYVINVVVICLEDLMMLSYADVFRPEIEEKHYLDKHMLMLIYALAIRQN